MKEVRKKSLGDFHKTRPSSSGMIVEKPPSVEKITPTVTSEGTVIPESSPIFTNIPQSSHAFTPTPIQATPTPPPTIETTSPLSNLPDFSSVFRFNDRITTLEKEVDDLKKDPLHTQVTS
ncbi:hypothetical protein Tco_0021762 [Tanacetum coccineum]